ncbi:apicoplast calcium binding protein 1, putative [Plasmodium reichenowi]|uniref:Apicoplast calcium binding protein 1, putative n=1 Tax=Plasmodium reichenowi TaxID=5854 RepID=A0A151L6Z5_PLARE|nr:apicoplast calcium binding protein 1, putative [Plasmodium reichenowi]KYN94738.1 apicoplast calcium binding protein 1, putative [Plasmodium reichenowi]
MKLLNFPLTRYDVFITRFFLFASFLMVLFMCENFLKKSYMTSIHIRNNKLCSFIHKNFENLEKYLTCDFVPYDLGMNDWKSLKRKIIKNGEGEYNDMSDPSYMEKKHFEIEKNSHKMKGRPNEMNEQKSTLMNRPRKSKYNKTNKNNKVKGNLNKKKKKKKKKKAAQKYYTNRMGYSIGTNNNSNNINININSSGENYKEKDKYYHESFNYSVDTNNPSVDEQVLKKALMVFKKLDINKNTYIDYIEFETNVNILSRMNEINKNILTYLFDMFDIDKDKKLNYTEFLSLNSYDFNYIKLVHIIFEEDHVVDKRIVLEYLEIYVTEFLETIIEEEKHKYLRQHNLIQYYTNLFYINNKKKWDLNEDDKLQIGEFPNFQLTLLIEIDHLSNFIQIDYNIDGYIDPSELLYYINEDKSMFNKFKKYIKKKQNKNKNKNKNNNNNNDNNDNNNNNNNNKMDVFKFMKEELNIPEGLFLNIKYLYYSFDINNDMLLNFEEYKDQVTTFAVLDSAPDIVYAT